MPPEVARPSLRTFPRVAFKYPVSALLLMQLTTAKIVADMRFTPASIAAVSCSAEIPGSSASERRAAARGILRHKQHTAQLANITKGGLHPLYLELHGRGQAKDGELREINTVLSDTFNDLLDTVSFLSVRKSKLHLTKSHKVSMLDSIDGGVSLVLRCPGYESSNQISLENLTIDVYISPSELTNGGGKATEHVALIVQAFGEHLALPHLQKFQAQCSTEGVRPLPAPGIRFFVQHETQVNKVHQHRGKVFW